MDACDCHACGCRRCWVDVGETMKPKPVKLVYVRWFDSSITSDTRWTVADVNGILENEAAGLLISDDKKSITLAMDRCIDTGGMRGTICIPKVNVRRIRRFKVTP